MTPREIVALHRLPLHHRRADAGRGASTSSSGSTRTKGDREAHPAARRLSRPTRRRPGWIGYSDDEVRRLCREALADGWTPLQGQGRRRDPDDDARRVGLVREAIGPDRKLMIDANQRWDVGEAIARVRALAQFDLLVDRGADQPGRRAGACRDCAGGGADRRGHRRALRQPRDVQAAAPGERRSASARSTAAASAASTRTSR